MRRIGILYAMIGLGLAGGAPCEAAKKWRVMEDCALIPNPANDGDSFHVRWKSRRYIFRLYFVDAPESDNSLPERVAEQSAYFGLDPAATIQVGKEAARFAEKFLADGFTIQTRREDARGRSERQRFYGIVRNRNGEDLAEALVANGLARIHGVDQDIPDDVRSTTFLRRLKGLELQAKNNRLGAWAPQVSRVEQRLAALSPADIAGRTVTLPQTTAVFAADDAGRQLGLLQRGAAVTVLGADAAGLARIRFTTGDGRVIEAQCRRSDLGL